MLKVGEWLELERDNFTHYNASRREIQYNNALSEPITGPSVKDMPTFDPYAEITGLTLTIPSWTRSIERVQKGMNFSIATPGAKEKLRSVLAELKMSIASIITAMEG